MASILRRALRLCGCARRHGIAHASSVKCVPPQQGEHCQSCSSAVHCAVSAGLKRFGALRAIVEAREQAICCRVADARSTQRWSQVGQAARGSASPQTEGRVEAALDECPQDCSRSSHHPLASKHLQSARGPKPARRSYASCASAAVHRSQGLLRDSAFSTRVQRNAAFSRNY